MVGRRWMSQAAGPGRPARVLIAGMLVCCIVLPLALFGGPGAAHAGPTRIDQGAPESLAAASPGMVAAAPGVAILPGSRLYAVKLWLEQVRLLFIRDAGKKLEYLGVLVERRSAEIRALVAGGRPGMVAAAAAQQERLVQKARDVLDKSKINDKLSEKLSEANDGIMARLEAAAGAAVQLLEQVMADMPQKAREAVENAAARLARQSQDLWDHLARKIRENEAKSGGNQGNGQSQDKPK